MKRLFSLLISLVLVVSIVFSTACDFTLPETDFTPSVGEEGGSNTDKGNSGNDSQNSNQQGGEENSAEDDTSDTETEDTENNDNQDSDSKNDSQDGTGSDDTESDSELSVENPALTKPTLNLSEIPACNEKGYVVINDNQPYFTKNQIVSESYEYYSTLDSLGRCGLAVACLGKDLMPSGSRSEKLPDPTGWHSNGIYERSHLIAYALAGEEANRQNLITGTYDLNGIMQEFESLVRDYIKETNNHVMYRVEPVFSENDLLCRGVQMEAYSVEDDGDGVCFNIFIYNAQDDVEIDYPTGDYKIPESQYTYIVHKTKHKILKTTCNAVHDMSEKTKEGTTLTLEELVEELTRLYGDNWSYCGTCKPQNG